ncbi:hypothetical protein NE865_10299 [Phthorimaea operculella]|nr:hypothetical protein NE865_10299 [Phthorimaea operculella]
MVAMIQIFLGVIMIETALSLKYLSDPTQERFSGRRSSTLGKSAFRRILESLASAKLYLTSGDSKSIDPLISSHSKGLVQSLDKRRRSSRREHGNPLSQLLAEYYPSAQQVDAARDPSKLQLRTMDENAVILPRAMDNPMQPEELREGNDERNELVINELQNSPSMKSSVLLRDAWVQKRGRNDFLVLAEEAKDPFVTVIPNNIYYNIEKKCVNWMDDCSMQGVRMKLLQKVNSPYKK